MNTLKKAKATWPDRKLTLLTIKGEAGSWGCSLTDNVQLFYFSGDALVSLMIPGSVFKRMCEWFVNPERGQRYSIRDWNLLDTNFKTPRVTSKKTLQFYHNFVVGESGSWWWVPIDVFKKIAKWYLTEQGRKAA